MSESDVVFAQKTGDVVIHRLFERLPLAKTVDDYDALLPWKMPTGRE